MFSILKTIMVGQDHSTKERKTMTDALISTKKVIYDQLFRVLNNNCSHACEEV